MFTACLALFRDLHTNSFIPHITPESKYYSSMHLQMRKLKECASIQLWSFCFKPTLLHRLCNSGAGTLLTTSLNYLASWLWSSPSDGRLQMETGMLEEGRRCSLSASRQKVLVASFQQQGLLRSRPSSFLVFVAPMEQYLFEGTNRTQAMPLTAAVQSVGSPSSEVSESALLCSSYRLLGTITPPIPFCYPSPRYGHHFLPFLATLASHFCTDSLSSLCNGFPSIKTLCLKYLV